MTREIKFRVWDFENKKFRDNSFAGAVGRLSESAHHAGYMLLQFTGLLDKNGKDIYEGDIVKFIYKNCIPEEERIMPVRLVGLGDAMPVRAINAYSPFCYTISGSYKEDGREVVECYLTPSSECEIIGNIYQNEDLLKS